MTEEKKVHVYRVPTRMRPQPWKHLRAWLFRTSVETTDYVTATAASYAHERTEQYEKLYYDEVKKRSDYADKHSPKLSDRSFRHQYPFTCTGCSCTWPCPDYRWAVDRPNLVVRLYDETPEESK